MEHRSQQVIGTFVELADTLTSDYDIGDFLQTLVDRVVEFLDVETAGVMLETPDGKAPARRSKHRGDERARGRRAPPP